MYGIIKNIRAFINNQTLNVLAEIETDEWGRIFAHLPARETAALIPRSILTGSQRTADAKLLKTINIIAQKLVSGRKIEVLFHGRRKIFKFLSWEDIRFIQTSEELNARSP